MFYKKIDESSIKDVMSLFVSSFYDDKYYKKLFPNDKDRKEQMINEFTTSIEFCLKNGISLGVFDNSKLIAFIITVDYQKLNENKKMYNLVFATEVVDENYVEKTKLQEKLKSINSNSLFCVSMAIQEEYRRRGLASLLIDYFITKYSTYNIVADVSNPKSLNLYKARGFTIDKIDEDYYFVCRNANSDRVYTHIDESIRIALLANSELEELGISYKYVCEKYIANITVNNNGYFIKKEGNIQIATIFEINYNDLLKYQKFIGVSIFNEMVSVDYLYYVCNDINYSVEKYNEDYELFLKRRDIERKICPDVFISIPVNYSNASLLKGVEGDDLSKIVLQNLDFRTKYEAGIISKNRIEKGNCAFKNRIKRLYLGKIKIKNCGEYSLNNYDNYYLIGSAYYVDMYVSYDELSKSAVVGLYSLSCPFLISLFFDNIIRNQVIVIDNENLNLFDYLEQKYGIKKSGSPKIYSVIPEDRNIMESSQIGALLSGEMIYEDGEDFGKIIDSDIIKIVESELGMGQYDRGCVLAYMNVLLQFDKKLKGLLRERIAEEIIAQFYIELVMFEESTINSTNDSITDLLSNPSFLTPVEYLKAVEKIQDDYSKTMCFWNITLNYPTSQKSVEMLRDAFRIEKQLEKMERNKRQLEELFDTKNDIIDRVETKRVDTSLAVLSILAIFSALIDCFDFIGVWDRFISEKVILGLQIFSTIAIVIVGIYVVLHIFSNKILRIKNKKKKK